MFDEIVFEKNDIERKYDLNAKNVANQKRYVHEKEKINLRASTSFLKRYVGMKMNQEVQDYKLFSEEIVNQDGYEDMYEKVRGQAGVCCTSAKESQVNNQLKAPCPTGMSNTKHGRKSSLFKCICPARVRRWFGGLLNKNKTNPNSEIITETSHKPRDSKKSHKANAVKRSLKFSNIKQRLKQLKEKPTGSSK